jgi:hypothetical protein
MRIFQFAGIWTRIFREVSASGIPLALRDQDVPLFRSDVGAFFSDGAFH